MLPKNHPMSFVLFNENVFEFDFKDELDCDMKRGKIQEIDQEKCYKKRNSCLETGPATFML